MKKLSQRAISSSTALTTSSTLLSMLPRAVVSQSPPRHPLRSHEAMPPTVVAPSLLCFIS